jgi:hypothetical protein
MYLNEAMSNVSKDNSVLLANPFSTENSGEGWLDRNPAGDGLNIADAFLSNPELVQVA